MTAESSSDAMLAKMRDALKRAAQSLQAVKDENKRLRAELDESQATIFELQTELKSLQHLQAGPSAGRQPKRASATAPAEARADHQGATSPPSKRAKAAETKQRTKKQQVSNAVQSWLGPMANLPALPTAKFVPADPPRSSAVTEEETKVEISDDEGNNVDETVANSHVDLAPVPVPAPVPIPVPAPAPGTSSNQSFFFSRATIDEAIGDGSASSDDEPVPMIIQPTNDQTFETPVEPTDGAGWQEIQLPKTQNKAQFVAQLLRQLTPQNLRRIGQVIATEKRAQNHSIFVAELFAMIRSVCQDIPQSFADYIHSNTPHQIVDGLMKFNDPWIRQTYKAMRGTPAQQVLLDTTRMIVELLRAITLHPSKGVFFYEKVTKELYKELYQQCVSKNVTGLKVFQRGDHMEEEEEAEDVEEDEENVYVSEPSVIHQEIPPAPIVQVGDAQASIMEQAVRSEVSAVFAALDSDSEEDSDASDESNALEAVASPVVIPVVPPQKLQLTTLRKERADWRAALLTMLVSQLCLNHPIKPQEQQMQVFMIDILKASIPGISAGYLYGLSLAWPSVGEFINLNIEALRTQSEQRHLPLPSAIGLCICAYFRQLIRTAAS